jgi:hypothetical protein
VATFGPSRSANRCWFFQGPALATFNPTNHRRQHFELQAGIWMQLALKSAALVIGMTITGGCHSRAHVVSTNPVIALSPTCLEAVPVYGDAHLVPYDYYEVALITGEGNSAYVGNGELLKAMRGKAATAGANGLILSDLSASHATVKVIGAALGGKDADRKGKAIAIWMPSDTARVRAVCGR